MRAHIRSQRPLRHSVSEMLSRQRARVCVPLARFDLFSLGHFIKMPRLSLALVSAGFVFLATIPPRSRSATVPRRMNQSILDASALRIDVCV